MQTLPDEAYRKGTFNGGKLLHGCPNHLRFSRRNGVNSKHDDALHGDVDSKQERQYEKPIHRIMQDMAMEGYTAVEIARATDRSPGTVANILRQPWARKRMIEASKKNVKDTLSAVLEQLAVPTLNEIVELGNNPETPAATKLACKQEVLNRFLGRPTQPILQEAKDPKSLTNEELQDEVARIVAAQAASAALTSPDLIQQDVQEEPLPLTNPQPPVLSPPDSEYS